MNIGVIGLGSWGSRVYLKYKELEKEKSIDKIYSCDNVRPADFKDYNDMLSVVDGVHICLPNKLHYPVAKKILSQGGHCLIEKPMTTSKTEAHHLIEIASEQGVILQVGYLLRFSNVLRKAWELINKGQLGTLYYISIRWTTTVPYMHGADIVWDILPHPLDIIHFLTGRFPNDSHQLMKRPFRRDKFAEVAFLNLDYDLFFANMILSWLDPVKRRDVYLYGSKSTMWIDCIHQELKIFDSGKIHTIPIEVNDLVRGEALNFIDCLKDGRNRFNSHIIGLQNTEVIESIMAGNI